MGVWNRSASAITLRHHCHFITIRHGRQPLKRNLSLCGMMPRVSPADFGNRRPSYQYATTQCHLPFGAPPTSSCTMFWFSSRSSSTSIKSNENENERNENLSENTTNMRDRRAFRRRKGLRSCAAQSVHGWLRREPFCFDRTVTVLNLNMATTRWRRNNSYSSMSDLPGQYRKAYHDSITSFINVLQKGDDLTPSMEAALDRLADAGFADVQFAQNFRKAKDNQILLAQTQNLLKEKTKQYEERQATAVFITEKANQLEMTLEDTKRQLKQIEDEGDKDSNFTDVTSDSNNDKKTSEAETLLRKSVEKEIQQLQRQLEGRKNHVASIEQSLAKLHESIESIKEHEATLQTSLSADEYQQTQEVVEETMLVLCDALADHIQQRHSTLIQQYQNMDSKTGK